MIHLKHIRSARRQDFGQIVEIDAEIAGFRKPAYWTGVLRRYGGRHKQRFFLVAEVEGRVEGYVVGEIRDWEFGLPPCGWVFGIGVRPQTRMAGVGTRLYEAICSRFRKNGVTMVRTLLARDNGLVLAFFRSQGMMAAHFIPLEQDLA